MPGLFSQVLAAVYERAALHDKIAILCCILSCAYAANPGLFATRKGSFFKTKNYFVLTPYQLVFSTPAFKKPTPASC